MTQQNISKIYNIRTHNHMNQRFITCYFKIAYTEHTKTYKISASHTIKHFIQKMKQYIRNDLYLELLGVPDFEFVCAGYHNENGYAPEEGPALIPTPEYRLDSLANIDVNNNDDSYLAFYIRPYAEQNTIHNNNNT